MGYNQSRRNCLHIGLSEEINGQRYEHPEQVYRPLDPQAKGWDIRKKGRGHFWSAGQKGSGDIIRSIGSLVSKIKKRKSRIGS